MNRFELWDRLKKARVTQSTITSLPSDAELKIVINHCGLPATAFIDFICSLDGPVVQPRKQKATDDSGPLLLP